MMDVPADPRSGDVATVVLISTAMDGVGVSLGGVIAQQLARQAPNRVRRP